MKLQEVYKNQLINNLKLFNVVLGLSTIGNPSIKEFLEASTDCYKKICRNKENKRKAVSTIMELCSDIMILSEDCSFYNLNLMDLSIYERLDFLLDRVLKFSSADSMKDFFPNQFMELIGYMKALEMNFGENIKSSTSYIVIRNFLVLCNLRMYRYAYYYATFIRCQIFISEGLSPRIEYSDLYKSELSLAIQKERNKFSKNIKKKITKNVIDIANKVPLVNLEEKRDSRFIGEAVTAPISNSNNSLEGMNAKVENFVEEYKKEKYDVSPEKRKENIKEGVKSAVSDATKTAIEGSKEFGKNVYSNAKDLTKEKLEEPLNAVKDKVGIVKDKFDNVKSTINESIGITNKEFDNHLETALGDNLDNISNSDSFSNVESKEGAHVEEKPRNSKLASLRNSRKNKSKEEKEIVVPNEETIQEKKEVKKNSAIENLRKAKGQGRTIKLSSKESDGLSSSNSFDAPSINKEASVSENRVEQKPSYVEQKPRHVEPKIDSKPHTVNLNKSEVKENHVRETHVREDHIRDEIPNIKEVVNEKSVADSDTRGFNNSGLDSSDLFSKSSVKASSPKVETPKASSPSKSSLNVRSGQTARIRRNVGSSVNPTPSNPTPSNSTPSKSNSVTSKSNSVTSTNVNTRVETKFQPKVETKVQPKVETKAQPKVETKVQPSNSQPISVQTDNSQPSSTSQNRRFVNARIRRERVGNSNTNSNTKEETKLREDRSNEVNTKSKNPSKEGMSFIGSSSFFS